MPEAGLTGTGPVGTAGLHSDDVPTTTARVDVEGGRVHAVRWQPAPGTCADDDADRRNAAPTLVMLHEGLGSITQWRDLPARLAAQTGWETVAYDRGGHGRSDAFPERYGVGFMEHEAACTLPTVLAALDVAAPVLIGHSDGASIALIAAARGTVQPLGIAAIAPHTFIEQVCIDAIAQLSERQEQMTAGLRRHHDHPRLVLERWRGAWLHPQFRDWDIRSELSGIDCPVIVLQGDRDEYGTDAQISAVTAAVAQAHGVLIADCGHAPHREQPDETARLLIEFCDLCRRRGAPVR